MNIARVHGIGNLQTKSCCLVGTTPIRAYANAFRHTCLAATCPWLGHIYKVRLPFSSFPFSDTILPCCKKTNHEDGDIMCASLGLSKIETQSKHFLFSELAPEPKNETSTRHAYAASASNQKSLSTLVVTWRGQAMASSSQYSSGPTVLFYMRIAAHVCLAADLFIKSCISLSRTFRFPLPSMAFCLLKIIPEFWMSALLRPSSYADGSFEHLENYRFIAACSRLSVRC